MKWFTTVLLATIIAALSPSLSAQWPLYPQGIPKGPDGRPNLNAPTPRASDGKPDLSGVWMIAAGPDTRALPFQPWAAELQSKRAAESGLNDPDGLCMPQGPLQYHVDPQPLEDRSDAEADSDHLRVELRPPHYLYGRPRTSASSVVRSRSGTATPWDDGTATRWSWSRTTFTASTPAHFMASSPKTSRSRLARSPRESLH